MTYYGKQRMESFKRAMFASRLNEETSTVAATDMDEAQQEERSLWLAGILTSTGPSQGQLAS